MHGRGKQPRPGIIFRGKGRFLKAERKLYDERVDVYAQPKAWADRPFSISWVKKTLHDHIDERTATEGKRPFTLMICDNLDSQVHADFLQALKDEGAQRNRLVAGETEMRQAIDGGARANVKMLASTG